MLSANEIKKIRSLSDKKFRDKTGLFCVEGEKMVEEALKSSFEVCAVYRKDEIGEEAMSRISAFSNPSPALAVLRKNADLNLTGELEKALGSKGLYLALDSIRDPGNLGTILRIADWFGIDAVFAAPDTVDIFNHKVVQSTMGAIFRVKFHYVDIPSICRAITDAGGHVYGTFLDGRDMYARAFSTGTDSPALIVIGNESNGISDAVEKCVTDKLYIPTYPAENHGSESLNAAVATAVVVSEFRRRAAAESAK